MSSEPSFRGTVRITRGGAVIVEYATGVADDQTGALCTPSTRFQVGSVSKQFVAAAVLLAHERRLLRLDEPISRWFDGIPESWKTITLHQLLSHSSGLGHWGDIADFDIFEPPASDELFARMATTPLTSQPGSRWAYSGPGYLLAAWSVERLTGVPYATFLSQQIFERLGMLATTSGTFRTGAGDARGFAAGARSRDATGLASFPGTGDVWSTVADLNRYSERLASGAVLSPASLTLLSTQQVATGMTFPPAEWITQDGYGYGCFLGRIGSRRIRFHTGDNPGYRSLIAWLPDSDVAIAMLSNDESSDLESELRRSAEEFELRPTDLRPIRHIWSACTPGGTVNLLGLNLPTNPG